MNLVNKQTSLTVGQFDSLYGATGFIGQCALLDLTEVEDVGQIIKIVFDMIDDGDRVAGVDKNGVRFVASRKPMTCVFLIQVEDRVELMAEHFWFEAHTLEEKDGVVQLTLEIRGWKG